VSNSHQFNRRTLPSSSLARPTLYIYIKERLWNEARERGKKWVKAVRSGWHTARSLVLDGVIKKENFLYCLDVWRVHISSPRRFIFSYLIGVARREDTGRSALHGWRPDWQLNKSRDRRKKEPSPLLEQVVMSTSRQFHHPRPKGVTDEKNKKLHLLLIWFLNI
jgi:hypothetical protein